jgi:hypothetical protein
MQMRGVVMGLRPTPAGMKMEYGSLAPVRSRSSLPLAPASP